MSKTVATEVIRRAMEGDALAVEEVCAGYGDRLRGYFFARGTAADEIGDLVQDTVLCLLKALREGTVAAETHEGWLFTVAGNIHANWLRRKYREPPREEGGGELREDAPADEAFNDDEDLRVLQDAVRGLPEKYREPLLLRYRGNLSYRDIAERLGTNRNTVGTWLHRAKRMLRNRLPHPD